MDLGLLQKEVAAKIGVNKDSIYNWERQRNTPEIRFIAPIIEFLGYDPFPEPETLQEHIVHFRTRRGWSQRKFAKRLGVDPSTVEDWETGRHKPSRGSMKILKDVLNQR